MKSFALILAFALAGTFAEDLNGHRHGGHGRAANRRRPVQQQRRGRQEEFPTYAGQALDAAAPVTGYGVGADAGFGPAADVGLGGAGAGGDDNLAMLEKSIPGVPGEDYPIFAEVPETAFSCEGQVEGGYYADAEAQCQVFHICAADGLGGLAKYSFLCPNGTIFNQNYFICDWWFNFDCSEAEGLFSLNEQIAAEREAATAAAAAAAAESQDFVAPPAPVETGYGAPAGGADFAPAPAADAGLGTYQGDRQGRAFRGGRRQQPRGQGRRGRQFRG